MVSIAFASRLLLYVQNLIIRPPGRIDWYADRRIKTVAIPSFVKIRFNCRHGRDSDYHASDAIGTVALTEDAKSVPSFGSHA
jgi:hypothetical protein